MGDLLSTCVLCEEVEEEQACSQASSAWDGWLPSRRSLRLQHPATRQLQPRDETGSGRMVQRGSGRVRPHVVLKQVLGRR